MTTEDPPIARRVIARCNGTELVDRGEEIWIVEKGGGAGRVATFVFGLLGFILIINGFVQLVLIKGESALPHLEAAAIVIPLGAVFLAFVVGLGRARKRSEAREAPPSFVLAEGKLLDAERKELAPLHQVRTARTFQATSSSKALTLEWPAASRTIGRGNPFGDPVDDLESGLAARGIARRG